MFLGVALLRPTPPAAHAAGAGAPELRGIASWYGRAHHGKLTASGETYDMHAFTAAHRTLAFGTRVRVKNLRNGRSVVVRINDRGPHARQRIIDVSEAAARELGIYRRGVGRVALEILDRESS
jgi:rare lipoprotein A